MHLPTPTPHSEPFWNALKDERILLQRCCDCGGWIHYPRPRCPSCLSDRSEWCEVEGTGTVIAYSVARQPSHAVSADEVPLAIAIVEVDGGPRLTTNIIDIAPDRVTVGMRVRARFDHHGDNVTLLRFGPL